MKRRGSQIEGSFVYRTIVNSGAGNDDFQIEVFRSKEEMEGNAAPLTILSSFDELLDFTE